MDINWWIGTLKYSVSCILFLTLWTATIATMELYFKIETKVIYSMVGFIFYPIIEIIDRMLGIR